MRVRLRRVVEISRAYVPADSAAWLEFGALGTVNMRAGASTARRAQGRPSRPEAKVLTTSSPWQNIGEGAVPSRQDRHDGRVSKRRHRGSWRAEHGSLRGRANSGRVMACSATTSLTGGGAGNESGSSRTLAVAYSQVTSPLQNVKPAPAIGALVRRGTRDRVVPSISSFAAAMQAAQACSKPVLIRIETGGSHGYRPTDKRIAELADQWAFAAAQMGMGST